VSHHEGFLLPKVRLEALVDGVFAIAMTILILEVKVPELTKRTDGAELLGALRHAAPTLAAYFFSFGMLGLFWVWHHRIAASLARLDKTLLAISLGFLSLVSFFPFAAALLGRYPTNPAALGVYMPVVAGILLSQAAFFGLARRRGLVDPDMSAEESLKAHRRNLLGAFIFLLWSAPSLLRLGVKWALGALVASGVVFVLRLRAK
jgi:uncharacterized membrane protein